MKGVTQSVGLETINKAMCVYNSYSNVPEQNNGWPMVELLSNYDVKERVDESDMKNCLLEGKDETIQRFHFFSCVHQVHYGDIKNCLREWKDKTIPRVHIYFSSHGINDQTISDQENGLDRLLDISKGRQTNYDRLQNRKVIMLEGCQDDHDRRVKGNGTTLWRRNWVNGGVRGRTDKEIQWLHGILYTLDKHGTGSNDWNFETNCNRSGQFYNLDPSSNHSLNASYYNCDGNENFQLFKDVINVLEKVVEKKAVDRADQKTTSPEHTIRTFEKDDRRDFEQFNARKRKNPEPIATIRQKAPVALNFQDCGKPMCILKAMATAVQDILRGATIDVKFEALQDGLASETFENWDHSVTNKSYCTPCKMSHPWISHPLQFHSLSLRYIENLSTGEICFFKVLVRPNKPSKCNEEERKENGELTSVTIKIDRKNPSHAVYTKDMQIKIAADTNRNKDPCKETGHYRKLRKDELMQDNVIEENQMDTMEKNAFDFLLLM